MDCVRGCKRFFVGGSGFPSTNDCGECSCDCGDEEGWAEYNILGRPSCVPTTAHLTFGAVGLLVSVVSLCHAVHQLNRQVIVQIITHNTRFLPWGTLALAITLVRDTTHTLS